MQAEQISDVPETDTPLRVIDIDPQTDRRWESLVTKIPTSLIHHPAWLAVLEEAYGYRPAHLACEDMNGQIVGVLPLFERRGWRSGRSFTSLFACPLSYQNEASMALMQAAVKRAQAQRGVPLRLKAMSNAFDGRLDGMVGVPVYETFLLPLPERADLLRLDSSLKRAIKKATKEGVQVRQAENENELKAWYGLYLQTMHRLLVFPKPYRFFEVAWKRLRHRGMLRLLLAEHIEAGKRRLIAGFLLLQWGQTVSYISAGWRHEDQALRPNDILHWQAIQDACAGGFNCYDFGDVPLGNLGLARYKSKWGAQANLVYDYSYPAARAETGSEHTQSERPGRRLSTLVKQRLPGSAMGLLSNWFYALHLY